MPHEYAAVEGSERVALPGARAIGLSSPHASIEVTLKLRGRAELPPLHGRPERAMTRDEMVAAYGASEADVGAVAETFGGLGLRVVEASPETRTVRLSGTVAAMEEAFQVKLFRYESPSGPYRGRVGLVHVPVAVADIVVGVFGLDDRRVARRRRHPRRGARGARALSSIPGSWYTPAELAAHYRFPPGDGAGQAAAVVEFGGGYFPDDLGAFCKAAGLAVPTVVAVSVDGTSTSSKDGAEGEVMLDVEVLAGACPGAKIVAYFADWSEQGWLAALDAIIKDKANDPGVVSISWGAPEKTSIWTRQAINQINQSLMQAAHLGITVCVAAGDDGSGDAEPDGLAHADFPASSPYVLAVGGTTIPVKGGADPDVVWFEGDGLRTDSHGSTGGGVSALIARPSWQGSIRIKSVNPRPLNGRVLPDLAANADWDASPYLLVVDGGAEPNGGTSAATPLVAALIAIINASRPAGRRVGYLTPVLYQAAPGGPTGATVGSVGCTDVVSGNNATARVGGYSAGPGYDAASGWGTPDGVKLRDALAAAIP